MQPLSPTSQLFPQAKVAEHYNQELAGDSKESHNEVIHGLQHQVLELQSAIQQFQLGAKECLDLAISSDQNPKPRLSQIERLSMLSTTRDVDQISDSRNQEVFVDLSDLAQPPREELSVGYNTKTLASEEAASRQLAAANRFSKSASDPLSTAFKDTTTMWPVHSPFPAAVAQGNDEHFIREASTDFGASPGAQVAGLSPPSLPDNIEAKFQSVDSSMEYFRPVTSSFRRDPSQNQRSFELSRKADERSPETRQLVVEPKIVKSAEPIPMHEGLSDNGATEEAQESPWDPQEHENFLIGVKIYGRNWKSVSKVVKTRTPEEVKHHAQKYLAVCQAGIKQWAKARAGQVEVNASQQAARQEAIEMPKQDSHPTAATTRPMTVRMNLTPQPDNLEDSDLHMTVTPAQFGMPVVSNQLHYRELDPKMPASFRPTTSKPNSPVRKGNRSTHVPPSYSRRKKRGTQRSASHRKCISTSELLAFSPTELLDLVNTAQWKPVAESRAESRASNRRRSDGDPKHRTVLAPVPDLRSPELRYLPSSVSHRQYRCNTKNGIS